MTGDPTAQGRSRAGRAARWRRVRRVLALVVVVGLVVAGGYTGLVAVRAARAVTLPAPDGSYPVGRTIVEWTDPARSDPLAPRPGTPRELSVWLWYPAAPGTTGPAAPYAPGAWSQLHLGGPAGIGETGFADVHGHALGDVPVAGGRFPIVVLEPGLGLAAPQYSALAEDVAAHGYLVVGVTPTYSANLTVLGGRAVPATATGDPPSLDTGDLHAGRAAADADRLVAIWAADARFAADRAAALDLTGQFAGHVDPGRVVYTGHSFGGAAALEACRTDPRCTGAVDLDGTQFGPVVRTGLRVPMLIMASDDSCVAGTCPPGAPDDPSGRAAATGLRAAGTGAVSSLWIDGMRHLGFTDYAAYYLAEPVRLLLGLGPIDGGLGLRITGGYLAEFLDLATSGRAGPLLSGRSRPYPQVHLLP